MVRHDDVRVEQCARMVLGDSAPACGDDPADRPRVHTVSVNPPKQKGFAGGADGDEVRARTVVRVLGEAQRVPSSHADILSISL